MSDFKTLFVSSKQISNFENDLNNGVRSFKKFQSLHPELSEKGAFELYLKEQADLMVKLLSRPSVRANSYRLLAVTELLEDKSEFTRLYNSIMEEIKSGKLDIHDPKAIYYPLDLETCKRSHLIDTIRLEEISRKTLLAEMKETEESFKKKYTPKMIKQNGSSLPKSQRDELLYHTQDHFGRIQYMIQEDEKALTERVRPSLISNLLDIYKKFKEFGFIDNYIDSQNKKAPNPIRVTSQNVDEFFTEKNLKSLTTTELLALNAFYFNRLTKELKGLEALHFVTLTPGFKLEDLTNSKRPSDLLTDSQKHLLTREFEFLNDLYDTNLAQNHARIRATIENQRTDGNSGLMHSNSTVDAEFEDSYPDYKNLTGKSYDEFRYKLSKMPILRNPTANFYTQKQYTLLSALLYMSSSKKIQNWGIVPDSKTKVNLDKDYLLLGFDIPGFNMPLFIHTPKDTVLDFAQKCMKTDKFPVYEGANDFVLQGKHLPTPVLIKAPKTLKDNITTTIDKINKSSFVNTYEKLYRHIHYLANPKKTSLPDHLRTPVIEKGKERLRFIRRFASLKDGSIYDEKELKKQTQK